MMDDELAGIGIDEVSREDAQRAAIELVHELLTEGY
jgi:hypothetical protein